MGKETALGQGALSSSLQIGRETSDLPMEKQFVVREWERQSKPRKRTKLIKSKQSLYKY